MTTAPLSTLSTWDRNFNQGDIGAIYTSISAFGFNGTLRVWRDGVVMAGNHALSALRNMKRAGEQPPEHITLADDGDWLIPVTDLSHLTRQQAEAFAIADNRTRDRATTDDDQLAVLLQEIANADEAMLIATGYDGQDLDALLDKLAREESEDGEDAGPEAGAGAFVTCPVCGERIGIAAEAG